MKLTLNEKISQLSFFNRFYKSEIKSLTKIIEEKEAQIKDLWSQIYNSIIKKVVHYLLN